MSMPRLLAEGILKSALTEPAPNLAELGQAFESAARRRLGRSLSIRHVDAGSCNGCELEIASAFGPVYDAGRFGARLVASPRHADGVLVTGVVTRNMAVPLEKTLDAVPRPRVVVACGDCALGGGPFAAGYGVADSAGPLSAPDVAIPGCPPGPAAITQALRTLTGR
jgi:formate hydrogenlyase subunit 7